MFPGKRTLFDVPEAKQGARETREVGRDVDGISGGTTGVRGSNFQSDVSKGAENEAASRPHDADESRVSGSMPVPGASPSRAVVVIVVGLIVLVFAIALPAALSVYSTPLAPPNAADAPSQQDPGIEL